LWKNPASTLTTVGSGAFKHTSEIISDHFSDRVVRWGACFHEGICDTFPVFPALVLIQLEGGVYLFWSDRKNDNGEEKLLASLVVAR
jgi:hypothetical protein